MKLQEKNRLQHHISHQMRTIVMAIGMSLAGALSHAQSYHKSYSIAINHREQQAGDIHKSWALSLFGKLYDLNSGGSKKYLVKGKQSFDLSIQLQNNSLSSEVNIDLQDTPTSQTYPGHIVKFKRIGARNSTISPLQQPDWYKNINQQKKSDPSARFSFPPEILPYSHDPKKYTIVTFLRQGEFAPGKGGFEEIIYFVLEN